MTKTKNPAPAVRKQKPGSKNDIQKRLDKKVSLPQSKGNNNGSDHDQLKHTIGKGQSWPELSTDVYHGIAGDFVRAVEPHSEADPVALLIQFLTAFGNVVGRGPHFVAEADLHHTNIFACLVGETAKGKKGSSWGQVERVFKTQLRRRIG